MRQILMNSGGAVVARVPRPIVERGAVLVRVQYSLISVGTEIAPLRSIGERRARQHRRSNAGIEYAASRGTISARRLRDPRKAMNRVATIARRRVARASARAPAAR